MEKIVQWIVVSSANPEKLSLTISAGLSLLAFFGLGAAVSGADADNAVVAVVAFVSVVGTVVSKFVLAYGAIRKVYLTWKGRPSTTPPDVGV